MRTIKTYYGDITIRRADEPSFSGFEVIGEVDDEVWNRIIISNAGMFEDYTKRNEDISYYSFRHPWESARSLLVYLGTPIKINKSKIKDKLILLKCTDF